MCNITYNIVYCCDSFLQEPVSLAQVCHYWLPLVSLTPAPGITFTCSLGGISHFAINTLAIGPCNGWNCCSINCWLVPAKLPAIALPLVWKERTQPFKVLWGHISLTHTPLPMTLSLWQRLEAAVLISQGLEAPGLGLRGVFIGRCGVARRNTASELLEMLSSSSQQGLGLRHQHSQTGKSFFLREWSKRRKSWFTVHAVMVTWRLLHWERLRDSAGEDIAFSLWNSWKIPSFPSFSWARNISSVKKAHRQVPTQLLADSTAEEGTCPFHLGTKRCSLSLPR